MTRPITGYSYIFNIARFKIRNYYPKFPQISGSDSGDEQEGPEEAAQDCFRRRSRGRRADRRRRDRLQRRREGVCRTLRNPIRWTKKPNYVDSYAGTIPYKEGVVNHVSLIHELIL